MESRMKGNFHVRFGERDVETRSLLGEKVRRVPTLQLLAMITPDQRERFVRELTHRTVDEQRCAVGYYILFEDEDGNRRIEFRPDDAELEVAGIEHYAFTSKRPEAVADVVKEQPHEIPP